METTPLHPDRPGNTLILVFLSKNAADFIVGKLRQQGYSAAAVDNEQDLFVALRSGTYTLAVTTRPDIDLIRAIRTIPVVNIEVFFHAALHAGPTPSKEFDGTAFLDRIGALAAQRPFRAETACRQMPAPPQAVAGRTAVAGCWQRVKNLLSRRPPTAAKM